MTSIDIEKCVRQDRTMLSPAMLGVNVWLVDYTSVAMHSHGYGDAIPNWVASHDLLIDYTKHHRDCLHHGLHDELNQDVSSQMHFADEPH